MKKRQRAEGEGRPVGGAGSSGLGTWAKSRPDLGRDPYPGSGMGWPPQGLSPQICPSSALLHLELLKDRSAPAFLLCPWLEGF